MKKDIALWKLLGDAVENGEDIAKLHAQGEQVLNEDLQTLGLEDCSFSACRFTNTDFSRATIGHTEFINCDFSGVLFRDAGLREVRFVNCKLVGAKFQDAVLQQVLFQDCIGDYASFLDARLRSCTMQGGSYAEACFSRARLQKWRCAANFRQAEFIGTTLHGIDFTQADIEGAKFTLTGLYGAIVTPAQAVELARLLGLQVQR